MHRTKGVKPLDVFSTPPQQERITSASSSVYGSGEPEAPSSSPAAARRLSSPRLPPSARGATPSHRNLHSATTTSGGGPLSATTSLSEWPTHKPILRLTASTSSHHPPPPPQSPHRLMSAADRNKYQAPLRQPLVSSSATLLNGRPATSQSTASTTRHPSQQVPEGALTTSLRQQQPPSLATLRSIHSATSNQRGSGPNHNVNGKTSSATAAGVPQQEWSPVSTRWRMSKTAHEGGDETEPDSVGEAKPLHKGGGGGSTTADVVDWSAFPAPPPLSSSSTGKDLASNPHWVRRLCTSAAPQLLGAPPDSTVKLQPLHRGDGLCLKDDPTAKQIELPLSAHPQELGVECVASNAAPRAQPKVYDQSNKTAYWLDQAQDMVDVLSTKSKAPVRSFSSKHASTLKEADDLLDFLSNLKLVTQEERFRTTLQSTVERIIYEVSRRNILHDEELQRLEEEEEMLKACGRRSSSLTADSDTPAQVQPSGVFSASSQQQQLLAGTLSGTTKKSVAPNQYNESNLAQIAEMLEPTVQAANGLLSDDLELEEAELAHQYRVVQGLDVLDPFSQMESQMMMPIDRATTPSIKTASRGKHGTTPLPFGGTTAAHSGEAEAPLALLSFMLSFNAQGPMELSATKGSADPLPHAAVGGPFFNPSLDDDGNDEGGTRRSSKFDPDFSHFSEMYTAFQEEMLDEAVKESLVTDEDRARRAEMLCLETVHHDTIAKLKEMYEANDYRSLFRAKRPVRKSTKASDATSADAGVGDGGDESMIGRSMSMAHPHGKSYELGFDAAEANATKPKKKKSNLTDVSERLLGRSLNLNESEGLDSPKYTGPPPPGELIESWAIDSDVRCCLMGTSRVELPSNNSSSTTKKGSSPAAPQPTPSPGKPQRLDAVVSTLQKGAQPSMALEAFRNVSLWIQNTSLGNQCVVYASVDRKHQKFVIVDAVPSRSDAISIQPSRNEAMIKKGIQGLVVSLPPMEQSEVFLWTIDHESLLLPPEETTANGSPKPACKVDCMLVKKTAVEGAHSDTTDSPPRSAVGRSSRGSLAPNLIRSEASTPSSKPLPTGSTEQAAVLEKLMAKLDHEEQAKKAERAAVLLHVIQMNQKRASTVTVVGEPSGGSDEEAAGGQGGGKRRKSESSERRRSRSSFISTASSSAEEGSEKRRSLRRQSRVTTTSSLHSTPSMPSSAVDAPLPAGTLVDLNSTPLDDGGNSSVRSASQRRKAGGGSRPHTKGKHRRSTIVVQLPADLDAVLPLPTVPSAFPEPVTPTTTDVDSDVMSGQEGEASHEVAEAPHRHPQQASTMSPRKSREHHEEDDSALYDELFGRSKQSSPTGRSTTANNNGRRLFIPDSTAGDANGLSSPRRGTMTSSSEILLNNSMIGPRPSGDGGLLMGADASGDGESAALRALMQRKNTAAAATAAAAAVVAHQQQQEEEDHTKQRKGLLSASEVEPTTERKSGNRKPSGSSPKPPVSTPSAAVAKKDPPPPQDRKSTLLQVLKDNVKQLREAKAATAKLAHEKSDSWKRPVASPPVKERGGAGSSTPNHNSNRNPPQHSSKPTATNNNNTSMQAAAKNNQILETALNSSHSGKRPPKPQQSPTQTSAVRGVPLSPSQRKRPSAAAAVKDASSPKLVSIPEGIEELQLHPTNNNNTQPQGEGDAPVLDELADTARQAIRDLEEEAALLATTSGSEALEKRALEQLASKISTAVESASKKEQERLPSYRPPLSSSTSSHRLSRVSSGTSIVVPTTASGPPRHASFHEEDNGLAGEAAQEDPRLPAPLLIPHPKVVDDRIALDFIYDDDGSSVPDEEVLLHEDGAAKDKEEEEEKDAENRQLFEENPFEYAKVIADVTSTVAEKLASTFAAESDEEGPSTQLQHTTVTREPRPDEAKELERQLREAEAAAEALAEQQRLQAVVQAIMTEVSRLMAHSNHQQHGAVIKASMDVAWTLQKQQNLNLQKLIHILDRKAGRRDPNRVWIPYYSDENVLAEEDTFIPSLDEDDGTQQTHRYSSSAAARQGQPNGRHIQGRVRGVGRLLQGHPSTARGGNAVTSWLAAQQLVQQSVVDGTLSLIPLTQRSTAPRSSQRVQPLGPSDVQAVALPKIMETLPTTTAAAVEESSPLSLDSPAHVQQQPKAPERRQEGEEGEVALWYPPQQTYYYYDDGAEDHHAASASLLRHIPAPPAGSKGSTQRPLPSIQQSSSTQSLSLGQQQLHSATLHPTRPGSHHPTNPSFEKALQYHNRHLLFGSNFPRVTGSSLVSSKARHLLRQRALRHVRCRQTDWYSGDDDEEE